MKISWENRTRLVGGENEFEKDKLAMFVFWGFMRDENLGELIILWVARTRGRRNLKLVLFAWRGILDCQRLSYGWFIAGIDWSWIGLKTWDVVMNFKKVKGEARRSGGGETMSGRWQKEEGIEWVWRTDIILRHGWGPQRMVYFKSLDNTLSLEKTGRDWSEARMSLRKTN